MEGERAGQVQRYEGRLAIIAEGAQACLSRRLGLVRAPPDLVAVRGYFSGASGPDEILEIHYERSIAPGYVWVFPVGSGRVNVGLGTFASQMRRRHMNLRADLQRVMSENPHLCRRLRFSEPESPMRGHPLRTNLSRCRLYTDNVLVAGEAAHLVNPLTGEGIASALDSGRMAARQAAQALEDGNSTAAALAQYARQITNRYASDHRVALLIRNLLTCEPILNRLVRRAVDDRNLATAIGLALIGVTSPKTLLKPSMVARYLF
jgi:flavin-dependent dehydrogenase